MPVLATIGLTIMLSFGGAGTLGLSEPDIPPEPMPTSEELPAPAEPPTPASPALPGALGLGAMAMSLAALAARRDDLAPGEALGLAEPPIVVFVPGHGQPHASRAFSELVDAMGLTADSTRYFEYGWAGGPPNHHLASQSVPIEDAATALNGYVAGVAAEGRPVYLVGFSKGGATIAELVADWDRGRPGPTEAVIGAALLDPPIASGVHGRLQSLGRSIGPLPDDGGYDPVRCRVLRFGCEDRRSGLGDPSAVEVVVVRNPKAGVTSFADVPAGLRVYDASDDGPTIAGQLLSNPLRLPGRIAEAHEAVLRDDRVAACIVAEMKSGRCDLPRRGAPPRLPSLRRPAIRPPSAQRVL